MNKLKCEACGSIDIEKQGEYFVCQFCGCKYLKEEVQKIIFGGVVQIDKTEELKNLILNADNTFKDGHYKEAYNLYSNILNIDPENSKATVFRAICYVWENTNDNQVYKDYKTDELVTAFSRAVDYEFNKWNTSKEFFAFCAEIFNAFIPLVSRIRELVYDNAIAQLEKGDASILGLVLTNNSAKNTKRSGMRKISDMVTFVVNKVLEKINDYSNVTVDFLNSAFSLLNSIKSHLEYDHIEVPSQLDSLLNKIDSIKNNTSFENDTSKINYIIGDTITFGNFAGSPIEWIVLKNNNKELMLISKYVLTNKDYNNYEKKNPSWYDSDLRRWMNNDFYNTSFNEAEKAKILKTKITDTSIKGGMFAKIENGECEDFIFALSESDFNTYSVKRPATNLTGTASEYWTRAPGFSVKANGQYNYHSISIFNPSPKTTISLGVRLAMSISI